MNDHKHIERILYDIKSMPEEDWTVIMQAIINEKNRRLNPGFRVPYPCPVGQHPFEEALKFHAIKGFMRQGKMQSTEVFTTLTGNLIIRSFTIMSMQLDLIEHIYSATPQRISAAMVKAIGKKKINPLFFSDSITKGLGVISLNVVSLVERTGWTVISKETYPTLGGVLYAYNEK